MATKAPVVISADNLQPTTPTSVPNVSVDVLAAALSQALMAVKPKEKKTIANRQVFNPLNPHNKARKFTKNYYQNYDRIQEDDLLDVEYELLPQLKPGFFIADNREGFLVEIVEVKRGGQRGIHIRYNNSKIDKRMELMSKCPDLESILRRCIKEYDDQKVERKRRRDAGEDED